MSRPSRFPVAAGNRRGVEYVTYREHDRVFTLMSRGMNRKDAFAAMRAERRAA